MILLRLAELIIIYISIISIFFNQVATSTNYWPQRKSIPFSQQHQNLQAHQLLQQSHPTTDNQHVQLHQSDEIRSSVGEGGRIGELNSGSSDITGPGFGQQQQPISSTNPGSRRLMIGQAYNNFSSIVPYSIVQDSDYGSANDQLMQEEEEEEERRLQDHRQHQIQPQYSSSQQINDRVKFRSTASDSSRSDTKQADSRALLPLDSNRLILPQMQQIKSRFNQGCVGGTKCQFFAFCWMSGGSLGASCGLLMTCCVTPSRQEIQPGFYGPVVNDPCK